MKVATNQPSPDGDGSDDTTNGRDRAWMRLRLGPVDARYGDGLVDGGRILQLFGDLATELSILTDGDEGLFRAYDQVEFLAPVHSGDFIEAEARITHFGRTSRRMVFEARRRIEMAPEHGPTAATLLPEPQLVVRASGTVVVPAEQQRLNHSSIPTSSGQDGPHIHSISPVSGEGGQQ